MTLAVETHALTKIFQPPRGLQRLRRELPTAAVREVSLSVPAGELFGLLGPNGAGKTTLVKMLCTLIAPTAGSARVAGRDLSATAAIRATVGLVVTDERSFYWRLTGRRNLHFFAALHGLHGTDAAQRISAVLDAVDLGAQADKWFSNYSTGMKQRLAIARSLLHRPTILFLDEPTRSLDPVATNRLHELVRDLVAREELTVFLITHDLAEAESLCTRVAVMHQGVIRAVGAPDGLRASLDPQRHYTVRLTALPSPLLTDLRQVDPRLVADESTATITFMAGERDRRLQHLLNIIHGAQVAIQSIDGAPPTLEQVFAHYTAEEP